MPLPSGYNNGYTALYTVLIERNFKKMKIAFFGTREYDLKWFEAENRKYGFDIKFFRPRLTEDTVSLSKGYDAVCAFVNAELGKNVLRAMSENGTRLLLMRCAGYNNIDLDAAKKYEITILRVPHYSPEAVAEHAVALALAANRRIHKAYFKVKDNNFSLTGLSGINFYGKNAGIIGTGKIGAAAAKIFHGFGMKILAYDICKNPALEGIAVYTELDDLLSKSDLISLHCPLNEKTLHIIDESSISKMKDGVILVNTSRGALIKTEDLIDGIRDNKFHAVGLDVYEEESDLVFNNLSDEILQTSVTSRLLSFPNVILTSHQAFLTREALSEIAAVTLKNASDYEKNPQLASSAEV